MIERIDHIVMTVASIEATVAFYTGILGMEAEKFGEGRICLKFGNQKINLHLAGAEISPHAKNPARGSADICFILSEDVGEFQKTLTKRGIPIELGPVQRTGATGRIRSIYVRDPDGNLIELSNYANDRP